MTLFEDLCKHYKIELRVGSLTKTPERGPFRVVSMYFYCKYIVSVRPETSLSDTFTHVYLIGENDDSQFSMDAPADYFALLEAFTLDKKRRHYELPPLKLI